MLIFIVKCGTPHIAAYDLWNKGWLAVLEKLGYTRCGAGEENIAFFSKS